MMATTSRALAVRAIDFGQPSLPGEWDRWVPPGRLGLTHRFLTCTRALQMEGGFRIEPLMFANGSGRPLGIACSYRAAIDGADLGQGRTRAATLMLRRVVPGFLRYHVIEIGLPAGVGYPANAGAPASESIEALAGWGIDEARRQGNALVVVRDIQAAAAPGAVAALARLGFQPTPLQPTFVVSLPFRSFDEYRDGMRSKYRWRLSSHLKATSSLRREIVPEFAALAPDLIELWRNLYERAIRYRRLVITQTFLEAVSGLAESRVLLLRRPDDSIAAFGLVYLDGPMLRYSISGFTREAAREEGVYYRMLYEVVRFAIENGCRAVSLGQSTAEPKMRVGGKPIPLSAWIWHPSPLKRTALGWFARHLLRPPAPPPEHNVFRTDSPAFVDPALTEGVC